MNKDWFDDKLRTGYPSESRSFDADATWRALQAKRRKKRRPALWFWIASMLIVVGTGIYWLAHRGQQLQPVATDVFPVNAPASASAIVQPPAPAAEILQKSMETKVAEPVAIAPVQSRIKNLIPDMMPQNASNHAVPNSGDDGLPLATNLNLEEAALRSTYRSLLPLLTDIRMPSLRTDDHLLPIASLTYSAVGENAPKKSPRLSRWEAGLSVHYGPSTVRRISDDGNYLEKRRQQERSLDLAQASIDLRYRLNPRIFLQTGLYLSHWTDLREASFQEEFKITDPNYLIQQNIRADGTIENIYGPADIRYVRTMDEKTYNRYRAVEIPMLVGAMLPVGNRWHIESASGVVVGIASFRSGTIAAMLDGDQALSIAPYRDAGALDALIRLACWHQWPRSGVSFGIGLHGRTSLNSRTDTGAGFVEKRGALGAGFMAKKRL